MAKNLVNTAVDSDVLQEVSEGRDLERRRVNEEEFQACQRDEKNRQDKITALVVSNSAVLAPINAYYEGWRERTLKKVYLAKHVEGAENYTEEGFQQFLAAVGNGKEYRKAMPGNSFFMDHIARTIVTMTDDPEKMAVMARDALDVLYQLIIGERSHSNFHTSGGLIEAFFKNVPYEQMKNRGRGFGGSENAEGQFKYCYNMYGKWYAMAVAAHQGWECDRHYGDGDYTNSLLQIKEKFENVISYIPPEYRDLALQAFVKYGGHRHAMAFWNTIPKTVEYFQEYKADHLLRYYFEMMSEAPDLQLNNSLKAEGSVSFPVIERKEMMDEFEALHEGGKYREDMLTLGKKCLEVSGWRRITIQPSFIRGKDKRKIIFHRSAKINIPELIDNLDAYFKGDELKVREALAIPDTYPWLQHFAIIILNNYALVEERFPDGAIGLIAYLSGINNVPSCMDALVSDVTKKDGFEHKDLKAFLALGTKMVGVLGDEVSEYFRSSGHLWKISKVKGESFEEFTSANHGACDIAASFPNIQGVRREVYNGYLEYRDDPKFGSFLKGLEIIRDRFESFIANGKNLDQKTKSRIQGSMKMAIEKYKELVLDYSTIANFDRITINPAINCPDQAAIISHFITAENDFEGHLFHGYKRLLEQGIPYQVAAYVKLSRQDLSIDQKLIPSYTPIDGLSTDLTPKKAGEILQILLVTKEAIENSLSSDENEYGIRRHSLVHTPTPIVATIESLGFPKLQYYHDRIAELEKDPQVTKICDFTEIKKELDGAIRTMLAKNALLSTPHISDGIFYEPGRDSLLMATNSDTQMAICGMAMFIALGVERNFNFPGLKLLPLKSLATRGLLTGKGPSDRFELVESIFKSDKDALMTNIGLVLPYLEEMVLEERKRLPGLMFIGGKIHTRNPMDSELFDRILRAFGLSSTSFKLIHADRSLLLPPMPTALELQMVIRNLVLCGVVDPDLPDLQFAVGGRLSKEIAPILGAATLLSTNICPTFTKKSFKTTDKTTDSRIMAYDAGVKQNGHPFDLNNAMGRTDKLGCYSIYDAGVYQLVGTLAEHQTYDGVYRDVAPEYMNEFLNLMRRRGLLGKLYSSAWVYEQANQIPDDSPKKHLEMVNTFTRAWQTGNKAPDSGIIGQVRELNNGAEQAMLGLREYVISTHPSDYEGLLKY